MSASTQIGVIDIWHQGAVVAAGLAELGHDVRGLSLTGDAAFLNQGITPVTEPGLSDLIREQRAARRLRFTDDPADAVADADILYLSTDTPVDDDDQPDSAPLFAAVRLVGPHLTGPTVLCVTAQVPIGTTEELAAALAQASGKPVDAAYVPEFLQLGSALDRFRNADRVVIGAETEALREHVATLYEGLDVPIVRTDIRSAEMAKHASNAFLAMSVSFINEIADLSEVTGADIAEVSRILRLDRRIGRFAYVGAGLGFSGGTLGRELRTLQKLGARHHIPTAITDATWDVNANRPAAVLRLVDRILGPAESRTLAVAGLAYKAGTPTLRRSRPLEIVRELIAGGWTLRAFDPLVDPADLPPLTGFSTCTSLIDAATGACAVVVLSGGDGIDDVDLRNLAAALDGHVAVDAATAWDREEAAAAGLHIVSLGRAAA